MDPNDPPEITPELLEQHPTLAICLALFGLYLALGLTGIVSSWLLVGMAWWRQLTLLPVQDWSPRPWGLVDIMLTGILVVVLQVLLTSLAVPWLNIDVASLQAGEQVPMSLAAVISASYLLAVGLITRWICLRFAESPAVAGWSIKELPRMLLVGLVAGFLTLPLIFALSALVTIGLDAEYEHPILEAMQGESSLTSYLLAVFAAVVVAPIAEEFLFRVLIQGWLQSLPFVKPMTALLGRMQPAQMTLDDAKDNASTLELPSASSELVLSPELQADGEVAEWQTAELNTRPPLWPTFVTGTLFGMAHWEYGYSFIPLIAFGIVLGLLYRATQSIWPCITLHLMLNASSMFAMGIGVYLERVTG